MLEPRIYVLTVKSLFSLGLSDWLSQKALRGTAGNLQPLNLMMKC